MEKVAILKNDGTPVKLNEKFVGLKYDINGFLVEFQHAKVKYKFYRRSEFNKEDQSRKGIETYYNESQYLKYKQYKGGNTPTIDKLIDSYAFKFAAFTANINDTVDIALLDFNQPFDYYFKKKNCSFVVKYDTTIKGVKRYKHSSTGRVIIPGEAIITEDNRNLNKEATGLFYKKNFGDVVNSWNIDDEKKSSFCEITTLIAFKINEIVEIIFPKILEKASYDRLDMVLAKTLEESSLTLLERTIFNLKKNWGYYSIPNSPHQLEFDATFSGLPNYSEFSNYNNGLINFYKKLYVIQDILLLEPPETRLSYLLELLPSNAISIIPYNIRVKKLESFIDQVFLFEHDESLVLRLVYSFSATEANRILDFLLKKKDGRKTNFEILFRKMDDQRLSRISFVSIFVKEEPNRKYFTNAIYELWKVSKYNFYYFSSGQPDNADLVNSQSYFLTKEGASELQENCVLTFNSESYSSSILTITSKVYFESAFSGNKIKIERVYKEVVDAGGPKKPKIIARNHFGDFHLFQPISLVGYQSDLEIDLPETSNIPAFLFHYVDDFDKLKDFDAGISLVIEIAVELALSYFTGGFSAFKDLRHLKYVTKIKQAMSGALKAEDTVLFWRGIERSSEAFSIPAAIFSSYNTYLASTTNIEEEAKLRQKVSNFFLFLTLASAGSSIVSRSKVAKAADEVLKEVGDLTANGLSHQLSKEVLDIVTKIKASKSVWITLKINDLSLSYLRLANKLRSILNINEALATELVQILSTKSERVVRKFNDFPEILDLYDDLTKVARFKRLTGFYEDFFNISDLQNIAKKRNDIILINGSTVKKIPIISEKTLTKAATGDQAYLVSDIPLHTMRQLDELLEHGKNLGINPEIVNGLIVKSYRSAKQVSFSFVKDWLSNYKRFLDTGVPYIFKTPEDLLLFKREVSELFTKYGLGDEIIIAGSSLTKVDPPDADFVLYLYSDKYNALLSRCQEKLNKLEALVNEFPSISNTFHQLKIKKIQNAINSSKSESGVRKLVLNSMFDFRVESGNLIVTDFKDEFISLSSVKNLRIVGKDKKKDFILFESRQGNRSISLPPEFNLKF